MSEQIRITFYPKEFAKVLVSMAGVVENAAGAIAGRANAMLQGDGGGFAVETTVEPRFGDSVYGTFRPVSRVVAKDNETSAEEAERKILETVVSG